MLLLLTTDKVTKYFFTWRNKITANSQLQTYLHHFYGLLIGFGRHLHLRALPNTYTMYTEPYRKTPFLLNKQKNHAPPFLGRRPSKDGFCSSGRAWYPSFSCPLWGKSGHRTCAHPRVSGIPPLLSGEAKQKARGNFLSWRKATRRRKFSTNLFL